MIRSLTFLVYLFISISNANANDIHAPTKPFLGQQKNIKNPKLLGDLPQLQVDWKNYQKNNISNPFVPSNPNLNIKNGFIRVDAVAVNDVKKLEADLRVLGMRKISTFGKYISGEFLISELGNASNLKELHSMRSISVATNNNTNNSGSMASQQGYTNVVQKHY